MPTAPCRRSTASTSRSAVARCSPCSAPTAPARRRSSRSSRATARPTPATSDVLGHDPARARARVPRAHRHRAAGGGARPATSPSARPSRSTRAAYPNPRPVDEVIELVGLAGRARRPRRDAVRRPAAPARPRARHRRRPRAAVPRRADHRLRPVRPPPGVGADRRPARARQDDPPHHPLHGGGAGAGRPRRRDRRRPRDRRGRRRTRSARRRASRSSPTALDGARRPLHDRRRPRRTSPRSCAAAAERGEELEGLTVTRPSLEDVYLELTEEPPMTTRDLHLLGRWIAARVRMMLRSPRALGFTFAFPLVLVTLFGALNAEQTVTAPSGGDRQVRPVLHALDRRLRAHARRATRASSSASRPRARPGCSSACAARRCRCRSTSARG